MPVFGKNASRHPSSELSLESGASSGKRCRLIFFFFFFHYEPRRRWYWMSATRAPFGIYNNSLSFYRAALKKPICPKGCLSLARGALFDTQSTHARRNQAPCFHQLITLPLESPDVSPRRLIICLIFFGLQQRLQPESCPRTT